MTRPKSRLMIAGGGTGGHVLAGIAVADAWKKLHGEQAEILFIGAQGGIEEKLVPRSGYPLELLKLGALNRASLGRKLQTFLQLPPSLWKSLRLLISHRPAAVLGVGGYASGPLVLMARLLGIRAAILEQNAMPGLTNRILGKWVNAVFSAFPGAESHFGKKVTLTGNPIRQQILPLPPAPRDPFTVFVFGGSQGALAINTLVLEAIPYLSDLLSRIQWIHQTGEKDFERVRAGHEKLGTRARVEKFIYDMPQAYAEASLLICRAGSSTLAEIAAVRRASVLIPFPFASDNHQEKNARVFVDAGAAELLVQSSAQGEDLARIIRGSIEAPARLDRIEKAVAGFYRPNAAREIAQLLL